MGTPSVFLLAPGIRLLLSPLAEPAAKQTTNTLLYTDCWSAGGSNWIETASIASTKPNTMFPENLRELGVEGNRVNAMHSEKKWGIKPKFEFNFFC